MNEQQRAERLGGNGGTGGIGGRGRRRPLDRQSDSDSEMIDSPPEAFVPPADEQISKFLKSKVARIAEDFGAAVRLNPPESAEKLGEKLDEVVGQRNEDLVAGRKQFWSNVAKMSSEFRQFAATQR